MSFQTVGGGSSLEAVVTTVNQNINELKTREVTEIFKDETGTRRVLLGKGPDGFYGMKVSQAGHDVYDSSNDDLVFNSDNNLFKIVTSGTSSLEADFSGGAGDTSVVVTHNLGYIPAVIVYRVENSGKYTIMPMFDSYTTGGGNILFNNFMYYTVDTTELRIIYVSGSASNWGTITFRYYILQETAN